MWGRRRMLARNLIRGPSRSAAAAAAVRDIVAEASGYSRRMSFGAVPADDYEQPAAGILPPPVILAPQAASYCAPPEPPRLTHTGPRIIYIGHQPTVDGPRVIYGTD